MPRRTILILALVALAALVVIVVLATQLTPQTSNPAFTTAVDFVNAASKGDDTTAFALLDEPMRAYVAANCPDGSPSACIVSFIPSEWGELVSAVFRRAAPDADDVRRWDVEVIAHYREGTGASGVCSLIDVAPDDAGAWRVSGWAGFIHCGDPASRDMATNPDTPHRAP
jgi:hypothetical protein